MKKRKRSSFAVNLLTMGIMLILIFAFLRVDEFNGVLSDYPDFKIIDANEEYDLLLVVDSLNEKSNLALYSTNTSYTYEFYLDEQIIYLVDSELLVSDYVLFNLEGIINEDVVLKVKNNNQVIDQLTFHYSERYIDNSYILVADNDYDMLLLQDNIESKSIVIGLLESDEVDTYIVVLAFLGLFVLSLIPFKKIFERLLKENIKTIIKLIAIHIMMTIVFFGLIIWVLTLLFGADDMEETTSLYDNVSYIYEETDNLTIKVSVGIAETFIPGEGSQLETTYRLKLLTNDESDYIGIYMCEEEPFGYISSISEEEYTGSETHEIFIDDKCSSDTFYIKVVDANTNVLVYETDVYHLYKDPKELVDTYNLTEDKTGVYVSVGIFLFSFLIPATLFDILYYKSEKSAKEKYEKKRNNNNT